MASGGCDLAVRVFWVLLGSAVAAYSYTLGLGKWVNPGPGLLPFVLGVLFLFLSAVRLVVVLRGERSPEPPAAAGAKTPYGRLTAVVVGLLAWGVFLESAGFLIATSILMVLLYRAAGYRRWRTAVLSALVTVVVTYVLFTYLGVRFPAGILRDLGVA